MHILLIHQSFTALDEPGGTRHHEMARHLAAKGHRITVIASQVSYLTGSTKPENIGALQRNSIVERNHLGQIDIHRVYTYPALHRSFAHRLFAFFSFMIMSFWAGLKVNNVDVVWGTSPPIFQGITAWALGKLKRAAFLFEVRDLWPSFAVGIGVLKQPSLIYASEWLERFLYRRANLVIVNSPGFIEHVRLKGARQVELVPNGSDISMFDPQDDGSLFRKKFDLEDKFVVLYAGAHGISNDLEVVLEAAHLLQSCPEVVIVFLGDGKEKSSLMSKATKMGLENVKFLPPIPKNEMPGALAAADTCLAILKPIPQYTTVYPNKVFDYMAAGRPVILAIAGVICQVVEGAEAGITIPPGNAKALAESINTLANNRELGYEMGKRGRAAVKAHFDRPLLARKLEKILLDYFEPNHQT
ncbi:MAG: glycosyltransferase family 4 protein [Anaerolineales bacterium]|nr:glycosyltransferase family 4 protein [Anaerolineales bacterium]